jgi:hypothetical protein
MLPITKLKITATGGSSPSMAFPVAASYLANHFFGELHCEQPWSSGCNHAENG